MSLTRTLMSSSQNKFILIMKLDRYLKNYYVEVKTFMQHIKGVLCFTVNFIWQTWMMQNKAATNYYKQLSKKYLKNLLNIALNSLT